MIPNVVSSVTHLCTHLRHMWWRPPDPDPPPADDPCPLAHPDRPLPAWVASDPVVQTYRALIGVLPWATFPERPPLRPDERPWSGPLPNPRAPFAAAYLIKIQEGKRSMSDLRTYLIEHPALVWWLGFARVPDPTAPQGFDVAASVPDRRRFGHVLRTLDNTALQFVLTATVHLLRDTLTPEEQATFGDTIAGDTQGILAWVKENNPKHYIKEGRLDKNRQPTGDPDCTLGVQRRRNAAPTVATGTKPPAAASTESAAPATPRTNPKPTRQLQVGSDIFWGYASGIVVTRMPDGTEIVLAERTRPFNESDVSYFFPLMAQVEARLGRRPHAATWDAAYDAHYVYDYFHQAGGWAAIPRKCGRRGSNRTFAPDGRPCCAAGLTMTLEFTYAHRTGLVPHERAKYRCPRLFPTATGEPCPCDDAHVAKGGCTTTIANTAGARIRHQLDRTTEAYKTLYAMRTMVERVNSQAEALDMLHPTLRRGAAIVNRDTLTYVLINLRALARRRAAAEEGRPTDTALTLAA